MLKPKPFPVAGRDGEPDKTFFLTKFPATVGREIVASYPVANVPKLGDYKASEAAMLLLMSYVYVDLGKADPVALTTRDAVNNHLADWEDLARVEWAQLEYNVSFLQGGLSSPFFATIKANMSPWLSRISTALSAQLLKAAKQPSTNSEQSTT